MSWVRSLQRGMRTVILAGQAGSGKDTVGEYIARNYNGVALGQADPMKRFARSVFGFTETQLWGPSEMRNARDPRFDDLDLLAMGEMLDHLELRFGTFAPAWVKDVLPDLGWVDQRKARKKLLTWFDGICERIGTFQGISPRLVLQTLGTEWGRTFSQNMWVDYAIRAAKQLLAGENFYTRVDGVQSWMNAVPSGLAVITDGRFRNEIQAVQEAGGVALRIIRPGSGLSAAAESGGVKGHASERELNEIQDNEFDGVVLNDGTLEQLYGRIDQLVTGWFGR